MKVAKDALSAMMSMPPNRRCRVPLLHFFPKLIHSKDGSQSQIINRKRDNMPLITTATAQCVKILEIPINFTDYSALRIA